MGLCHEVKGDAWGEGVRARGRWRKKEGVSVPQDTYRVLIGYSEGNDTSTTSAGWWEGLTGVGWPLSVQLARRLCDIVAASRLGSKPEHDAPDEHTWVLSQCAGG